MPQPIKKNDKMNMVVNPPVKEWPALIQRPVSDPAKLEKKVRKILEDVRKKGDKAIRRLTHDIDGIDLKKNAVTQAEITDAENALDEALKKAIRQAAANIRTFHATQLTEEQVVETMPGVRCWRRSVPVDKVGLYIPGGSAPLFSTVLMLGIPAALAGSGEIILCTPPGKTGNVNPAILFAAKEAGITRIFKVGGAQAIGAMAFGTETIPAVYKIFGPGNQYVTTAKQVVQTMGIAIDMPAGPSEVCIFADDTANPEFVAADMLSQAEHGPDSQAILVTTSTSLAKKVAKEIRIQMAELPRKSLAEKSIAASRTIVFRKTDDAIRFVNDYAAEHLILACVDDELIATQIHNAGSVFLGHYSPESAGDYASGTNHTLPTNGFARSYSGISVDSFMKKITFQKLSAEGLENLGDTIEIMAMAEGLQAHAKAVQVRRKERKK